MYEVIYYSMTNNTKKVADAIAQELGVVARDVKAKKQPDKGSFLFLGSGCYGSRPGKEFMDFIDGNDFKGRNVAIFGTSASQEGMKMMVMEKVLAAKGTNIVGKFSCRGKWLCLNRKHPDGTDLENARRFAQEMKKG